MFFTKEYLIKKRNDLQQLINTLKNRLMRAPEGKLYVSSIRGKSRFYISVKQEGERRRRIYLKKEQCDQAKALAQKEYEEKVLEVSQEQLETIQSFLTKFNSWAIYEVYDELPVERKALVEAGTLNTEEYVRRWESVPYTPGSFEENAPDFQTMKKERVRSKSEQIIADWFYNKKIPYRYEFPWKMKDGRTIHPDFTLLNVQTREVFIFEHFGRMDDPNYVNGNFLPKMRTYMENGFFPGEKLLFTMESKEHPFTTVQLEQLVSHYFPISQ